MRHAIQTFLTNHPQFQLISVARLSVEPESGITLVLSTFEPVPLGFRRGLRNAVREAIGEPLLDDLTDEPGERVRIYIMLEAPYVPETNPEDAKNPADVIELEIAEPPVDRRLDDDGS